MAHADDSRSYCNLCSYESSNRQNLTRHIMRVHQHDARFSVYCCFPGCTRSARPYKKWDSFRKHVHRKHREVIVSDHEPPPQSEELDSDSSAATTQQLPAADADTSVSDVREPSQWDAARFLLHCSTRFSMTYTAVDGVGALTEQLVEQVTKSLATKISAVMNRHDVAESTRTDILNEFTCPSTIFDGLRTRSSREKFYTKQFNLVKPTPVVVGTDWEWTRHNQELRLTHSSAMGYYVDMFEGLEALFSNSDVLEEVTRVVPVNNGYLSDLRDGDFFKTHEIFSKFPTALQFIIYYDELEVCNPLGSKNKIHKLGVFYYTLGNIRPSYRSTYRSIQLLAIAASTDIKSHGVESLLSNFIDSVNQLSSADGHVIAGQVFHGALLAVLGDTPASCYLGGYKESCSFAFRKCRACLATENCVQTKFHESLLILRNAKSHMGHCELVELAGGASSQVSSTYGINSASVLCRLTYFDPVLSFPMDIMHVLFEGVVPLEISLLLAYYSSLWILGN